MNAVAKKLLMKPGQSWLIFNSPDNYLTTLQPLPEKVQINYTPQGYFDGIQLFALNRADLAESLKTMKPVLRPETIFWIVYPKKSSGITSDLEMMGSWDEIKPYGLSIVAAAAIDVTWTALRLRPVGQSKKSDTRNSEISNNNYAAFVNVTNKTVTLPPKVKTALAGQPPALANFEKLSYSNKKEYVLWILTAKQDKTRADRLKKMTEKLLAGKKNPSEK